VYILSQKALIPIQTDSISVTINLLSSHNSEEQPICSASDAMSGEKVNFVGRFKNYQKIRDVENQDIYVIQLDLSTFLKSE